MISDDLDMYFDFLHGNWDFPQGEEDVITAVELRNREAFSL